MNIGYICENFNHVGNVSMDNDDISHINVRGDIMNGKLIFNIFIGISL